MNDKKEVVRLCITALLLFLAAGGGFKVAMITMEVRVIEAVKNHINKQKISTRIGIAWKVLRGNL